MTTTNSPPEERVQRARHLHWRLATAWRREIGPDVALTAAELLTRAQARPDEHAAILDALWALVRTTAPPGRTPKQLTPNIVTRRLRQTWLLSVPRICLAPRPRTAGTYEWYPDLSVNIRIDT